MANPSIDIHTADDNEFRAASQSAAVFPSNAGRLQLTGHDARDLLNRLSTNLVDPNAQPGHVAVTVLTSDRGRIVDLVYVAHCGDRQLLITSPGQQQTVTDFLDKYTIMEDLEVTDVTHQTTLLAITGPNALDILNRAAPKSPELTNALRIDLPTAPDEPQRPPTCLLLFPSANAANQTQAALQAAGAVPISPATAETLRISNGQPAHGSEMSDAYNPLEAGLIGAIDFHKGCYIGQEVIARLDTYQKVQKYLVTLRFEPNARQTVHYAYIAANLPGARLTNPAGDALGLVTSATLAPSPNGDTLIGLGYVRTRALQIGARLNIVSDNPDAASFVAKITAQPLLFGPEQPAPSTR